MLFKKFSDFIVLYLLFTSVTFAMEDDRGKGTFEIRIYESRNDLPGEQNAQTSNEILGKSLAYGLIEGAVTESAQMLENILYNAVLQKGPEAAQFLAEELGKIAGDHAGRLAVKLAVERLMGVLNGSQDVGHESAAMQALFIELHGYILGSIFRNLDPSIQAAKEQLARQAGRKAKEAVNNSYLKDNESAKEKSDRDLYCFLAKHSTYYATTFGLNAAEKVLQTKGKSYLREFIKESEYIKGYADQMEYVSQLTNAYREQEDRLDALQIYSDSLLDNQLSLVPKFTSCVGRFAGFLATSVTGNYLAQKAADTYIAGISAKCITTIKSTCFMQDLAIYLDMPVADYLEILEREIAGKEQRKRAQEKKAELDQFLAQAAQAELDEQAHYEQAYEEAYVRQYSTNTIYSVFSVPFSAGRTICNAIYDGTCQIAHGAIYCAKIVCTSLQELCVEEARAMYRKLSPAKMHRLGYAIAGKISEQMLLGIITRGQFYPNLSRDEIIFMLHNRESKKDTLSYRFCDNVVRSYQYCNSLVGGPASDAPLIEDHDSDDGILLGQK